MSFDQCIYLIKNRRGLKELYRAGDEDIPEDLNTVDEFQWLQREYSVQQFMFELAKAKGIRDKNDFYGSYLRVRAEDLKSLYDIVQPAALAQYASKWYDSKYEYDEQAQERIRRFCKKIIYAVTHEGVAAYCSSDW